MSKIKNNTIQFNDISFSYNLYNTILENLSFSVGEGEIVGLLGPNGSGKTTIFKLILALLKPQAGSILIQGQDNRLMATFERAKKVAYAPQDFTNSFPTTVFESVLMGRRPYIGWGPSETDIQRTAEILESLDLSDLAERQVNRMSGGQKQKVILARALVQDTPFVLLDEPTGNLDLRRQVEVLNLMRNISQNKRIGILIALHDINMASYYTDKVVLLSDNNYLYGNTKEIINKDTLEKIYGVDMNSYMVVSESKETIWFPKIN
ncbi:MAG: ABC transporter ATP-binding protein [Deltaproteobacteria bacterium]|jgi:iron complex transport system ATP-binding protein|nr:ABC transporter ATP-binding protein [Deltaproteobacteria bacterium]